MAKAALETAVLDAELRAQGISRRRASARRATRSSVASPWGSPTRCRSCSTRSRGYLDAGYRRVKLKIRPGWDVEPVAAFRKQFGDVPLQVDANGSYRLADAPLLAALDRFELLLIEQPLAEDDLGAHAGLARLIETPICLDESITSARRVAIELGACSVVCVKAGRVGGYLEAVRVHDVCRERGVPVWCGGMLETGLGRAANLALAALPASRCRAISRRPIATSRATSPRRSCSPTVAFPCRRHPGSASLPTPTRCATSRRRSRCSSLRDREGLCAVFFVVGQVALARLQRLTRVLEEGFDGDQALLLRR